VQQVRGVGGYEHRCGPVSFGDLQADRKPQPGPLLFRREERLEESRQDGFGNAGAVIADFQ